MTPLPTLTTDRLILRGFAPDDAANVRRLAGAREVADTTLTIPHPYEAGMAEEWIATHQAAFDAGVRLSLAVCDRSSGALLGAIGLAINAPHANAELGYWIGLPYWRRGYCTEAARAMLGHAFGRLGLHRVHASHFVRNPASGRVMQKIGMTYEGCLRQHVRRWEVFEDLAKYGILDSEWRAGLAPDARGE